MTDLQTVLTVGVIRENYAVLHVYVHVLDGV